MRSVLFGLLLVVAAAFNAPAGVLYSFSQPASQPGSYPSPAVNFDFTVPSLLTSPTTILGSSINSPGVHYAGLDLSILEVTIDPGLNGEKAPVIGNGVPFVGIRMGWNDQVVMSEGACFVPDPYSCMASPAAQIFDHFGTFTDGTIQLTIASTDVPQTAAPEPRSEAAVGLLALLTVVGVTRQACPISLRAKFLTAAQ